MTTTDSRLLRATQHAPGGEEIVWTEPTARRVRVYFGGIAVADSNDVMILFNGGRIPVYYFPLSDVRTDLVEESDRREMDPRLGERSHASLAVGPHRAEDALFSYRQPIVDGPDLSSYVSFVWDAMDAWFEEDEQILRHARDPYKRVDVLHSSRHIRVLVESTVIADTHRPMLLFETGLPVRYYIPKLDVRLELLTPTSTRTRCPYKGEAIYWSLEVADQHLEDIVWSYPAPIPEIPKIENLLSFYNEKVDIEVDGDLVIRPRTAWS
jgi:uncharacterized protein (DUF427 family)